MTPDVAAPSLLEEHPVRERIRALTGLVFPESRMEALRTSVAKEMQCAGAGDAESYLSRLAHEPALLDDLVAEITVGETYFFRDTAQCGIIRDRILPELLHPRTRGPLRIWSAGCATGEEAYTLAILHAEAGASAPPRILGTDLSRRALARARRGRYERWALRGVTPEQEARYFQPRGGGFALRPGLVPEVEFRYLNLAEDAYPSLASGISAMDLILCRNVLIYFDGETAAQVLRRLTRSLAPGGWLLLGASDPVPAAPWPCEVVVTEAGLAYRRTDGVGPSPRQRALTGVAADLVTPRPAAPGGAAGPLPEPPPPEPPPLEPPPLEPPPRVAATGTRPQERPAVAPPLPAPPPPKPDLATLVAQVRALANAGDLEAAGGACASALDLHRTSAELTYLHGVLLAEAGQPAAAAGALRASLYLDRTLAVAHLALGGTLARLGDEAGARRALRNAENLLGSLSPDADVPASDGERAGRLAAAARAQLALLAGEAP